MKESPDTELWSLTEQAFSPTDIGKNETLFTVANGYLGLRGNFDEPKPVFHRGTYINAFFEKAPIIYGEAAFGYAENHQTLLNLPDIKGLRLWIAGEEFQVDSEWVSSYKRTLNFRTGRLSRQIRFRSPAGLAVEISSGRLVCLTRQHIAALDYTVRLLASPAGKPVSFGISSIMDASVSNRSFGGDPRVGSKLSGGGWRLLNLDWDEGSTAVVCATDRSRLAVACVVRQAFWNSGDCWDGLVNVEQTDFQVCHSRELQLLPGQSFNLKRYAAYVAGNLDSSQDLFSEAYKESAKALESGYDILASEQAAYLEEFWNEADVQIEGAPELQQALRFNIFHILQSAGRNGRTSIAAKGLAGEGYEGHYFWDTEIFVCPFFNYTRPELARKLLEYRYFKLDQARRRARVMGEVGALFPWRTIDGEEASAYYPAGTAQYHINADIAYAIEQYGFATGDRDFLDQKGAEIAVETARLWLSLGHYARDGSFRIDEVTGPDEYTALVNNNCYTNLMARNNLRFALRLIQELQDRNPQAFQRLCSVTNFSLDEMTAWAMAADSIYLPYNRSIGIYSQDDSFLDKKIWDFKGTPADNYPLLLHYHPLVIYRHQVLKQPDLVLAQFLLSEEFSLAEKIRNFRYYEPLTTGDSSLSHCIQCIMAAEIGASDAAYDYFMKTVRMDLDDIHGNSRDGIHTAAMAGSWMSVIYGFAGFRDRAGLSFKPCLPKPWTALAFALRYQGQRLRVQLSQTEVVYCLERLEPARTDQPLELRHRNISFKLQPGEQRCFSLKPKLRAVLLDLDGVLADTTNYHYLAWKRLANERGWRFDRLVNQGLKGVSRRRSLELILEHNQLSLQEEDFEAVMEKKNRLYLDSLAALSSQDLLPGISSLLRDLGRRGVRRIVASASQNAPIILDRLGLGSRGATDFLGVDAIVDPATLVRGKPDPELFLAAVDLAGCSREDCVGIEDAQAGIEALKLAGIRSVGVGRDLVGASYIVSGTEDLTAELLERVLTGYMELP